MLDTIRKVSPCNLAWTRHCCFWLSRLSTITVCKHPLDGDGDNRVPHLATYRYARATRVRLQRSRDECPPTHAQRRATMAFGQTRHCSTCLNSAISSQISRDVWAILFRHPQPRIQPQALMPSSADHPPHYSFCRAHLPPASQFRLRSVWIPVSQGLRLMGNNRRPLLQPFDVGNGIYRCDTFVDNRPKNLIN